MACPRSHTERVAQGRAEAETLGLWLKRVFLESVELGCEGERSGALAGRSGVWAAGDPSGSRPQGQESWQEPQAPWCHPRSHFEDPGFCGALTVGGRVPFLILRMPPTQVQGLPRPQTPHTSPSWATSHDQMGLTVLGSVSRAFYSPSKNPGQEGAGAAGWASNHGHSWSRCPGGWSPRSADSRVGSSWAVREGLRQASLLACRWPSSPGVSSCHPPSVRICVPSPLPARTPSYWIGARPSDLILIWSPL